MEHAYTTGGSFARLRAQWKSLAPPDFPTDRRVALARIVNLSAWVILLAALPVWIYTVLAGDNHRSRAILLIELCLLATLWLNRSLKVEWAIRILAVGVLASAALMVAGSPDGFHDVGLLMFPGALVIAAQMADIRFYAGFSLITLAVVTGLAASNGDPSSVWCSLAILTAISVGNGFAVRGAWSYASALNSASRRLHCQVNRMPLALITWDRDHRITQWNRAAESIFGWTSEEVLGRQADFLVPVNARAAVAAVWNQLDNGDQASYSVNENTSKDGKRLICEWFNTAVCDSSGQIVELLTMAHDITARHRSEAARLHSEEQLRQVWENSRDGMRLSDQAGNVLHVNAAYCVLVNKSREELEGADFTVIHAAAVQSGHLKTYRRRVRDRDIASRMERPVELWDGRTVWMDFSNSIIESPEGPQVLSIFRDVTARKLDESRLTEALSKAEAANRAKSEFLANMSHEIRTPLTGVLGMTALVLDGPLEREQREHLEMAQTSAKSLLCLLNDILDLSKIEAGRLAISPIDFSPRQLIEDLVQSVKLSAHKKGLELRTQIAAQVPAFVNGDPLRLRQVLTNLVGNAIKFTERGSVTIGLQCTPQPNQRLCLAGAVIDTGIGVPADRQREIFEAFAQADGSTTRRFGGTGLGLTICTRLLKLMDGTISVESQPGQGSTFRFTTDVGVASGVPAPQPAPMPPVVARPLSILVAEDNPVNQLVFTRMLERWGHSVRVAGNGREAVDLFRQDKYDAVLMDIQMPEMGGLEAIRLMRKVEAQAAPGWRTYVVALTANAMPGDKQICLDAGMDGYLSKPVDPHVLAAALGCL